MKVLWKVRSRILATRAFSSATVAASWDKTGYPPNYDPKESNLTPRVWELTKRKLYINENHPIATIKNKIHTYFLKEAQNYVKVPFRKGEQFILKDNFDCVVTTKQCFDDLLIPLDHVSRKKSDTYYINKTTLLRTHTSAHQIEMMKAGIPSFLIFGIALTELHW